MAMNESLSGANFSATEAADWLRSLGGHRELLSLSNARTGFPSTSAQMPLSPQAGAGFSSINAQTLLSPQAGAGFPNTNAQTLLSPHAGAGIPSTSAQPPLPPQAGAGFQNMCAQTPLSLYAGAGIPCKNAQALPLNSSSSNSQLGSSLSIEGAGLMEQHRHLSSGALTGSAFNIEGAGLTEQHRHLIGAPTTSAFNIEGSGSMEQHRPSMLRGQLIGASNTSPLNIEGSGSREQYRDLNIEGAGLREQYRDLTGVSRPPVRWPLDNGGSGFRERHRSLIEVPATGGSEVLKSPFNTGGAGSGKSSEMAMLLGLLMQQQQQKQFQLQQTQQQLQKAMPNLVDAFATGLETKMMRQSSQLDDQEIHNVASLGGVNHGALLKRGEESQLMSWQDTGSPLSVGQSTSSEEDPQTKRLRLDVGPSRFHQEVTRGPQISKDDASHGVLSDDDGRRKTGSDGSGSDLEEGTGLTKSMVEKKRRKRISLAFGELRDAIRVQGDMTTVLLEATKLIRKQKVAIETLQKQMIMHIMKQNGQIRGC